MALYDVTVINFGKEVM